MTESFLRRSPPFFCWADTSPKRSDQDKLQDAIAEYTFKYGHPPAYCLCHGTVDAEVEGVEIRHRNDVGRNQFYLGDEPW